MVFSFSPAIQPQSLGHLLPIFATATTIDEQSAGAIPFNTAPGDGGSSVRNDSMPRYSMVAAPGQPYVSPSRRVWRREGFQSHADSRAGGALTEITSPCREERPTPQPTPSGEGLQQLQAFYQSRVSLDILSKTIDWVLCRRRFHALLGAPYRKFEDPSACFVASRGSLLGG